MELRNKLALFLLLSVCSVSCYPSRPLNDRPSELTWQAWLLVDSQNQLQNESDRRITPKSVFIAPKLGQRNDSLPDCADGYRADSMGRCIKFVKVDEAAHLNFLLSRLNEMYAANSEEEVEESDESMPTAGPLQVNIPLGQSDEDDVTSSEEEVKENGGIGILAPANGQFDDKLNVKRHPDAKPLEADVKKSEILKPNVEQVEIPPQTEEDYDYFDENTEETTTQTELPTSTLETTTEYDTTTEVTTETTEVPTTTLQNEPNDELKALFFLMPVKNETEKTNASQKSTTTTQKPIAITFRDDIQADSQHVVESVSPIMFKQKLPFIQQDEPFVPSEELPFIHKEQQHQETSSTMRFPQESHRYPQGASEYPDRYPQKPPTFPDEAHRYPQDAPKLPDESQRYPQEAPKFPDRYPQEAPNGHIIRFPIETNVDVRQEYPANVKPHYGPPHHRPHTSELSPQQVQEIFKTYVNRHAAYAERPQIPHDRVYNHRNRDRNEDLWSLTPTIKEDKPLLMRFGRYPSPYYSSQKHETPHHEVQFFEDDTGQDYSNTYGRKRRRGNLR